MSLLDLTPEEQEQAAAAVAKFRAEMTDASPPPPEGRLLIEQAPPAPAAEPTRSPLDELLDEQDRIDGEDFTAFWTSRKRRGATLRNVVPGVDVELPAELPLAFEVEARRLADDKSMAAVHHLFAMLYGAGTLSRLLAGGLTGDQLGLLILWGSANGAGRALSLAEATVEFERMKAAEVASGKAPGPASPGSGGTSAATGDASRPTSPASTA